MPRTAAIIMWAKSWHTPRRRSKATAAGVSTSVASGSYTKSERIRRVNSIAALRIGRCGVKLFLAYAVAASNSETRRDGKSAIGGQSASSEVAATASAATLSQAGLRDGRGARL